MKLWHEFDLLGKLRALVFDNVSKPVIFVAAQRHVALNLLVSIRVIMVEDVVILVKNLLLTKCPAVDRLNQIHSYLNDVVVEIDVVSNKGVQTWNQSPYQVLVTQAYFINDRLWLSVKNLECVELLKVETLVGLGPTDNDEAPSFSVYADWLVFFKFVVFFMNWEALIITKIDLNLFDCLLAPEFWLFTGCFDVNVLVLVALFIGDYHKAVIVEVLETIQIIARNKCRSTLEGLSLFPAVHILPMLEKCKEASFVRTFTRVVIIIIIRCSDMKVF